MNTIEELGLIRRRIGGVEHELDQLKKRVSVLEGQAAAEAMAPTPVVPPVATAMASAPVAEVAPALALVPRTEEPPVVEPVTMAPPPVLSRSPEVAPPRFREPEPSWLEQARPWLERLQLWPPSSGESTEVQLGAWWATRLGILFAVIGAVFFGVYVSLNTPPAIKLIELAVVAAAVTGFGAWMERKTPRFGQVVFAGGLALLFFTAMAAYTVPAVKVLDNRLVAALWQLAVTAGIGAVAWRRNSQPVATMAVVLGYVAAWFSFSGGLQLFALASALGLAVTAVVWKRWLAWEAPSLVALAGYWAIYGTLLVGLGTTGRVPLPPWGWGFVVGGFAVFFWRDDRTMRAEGDSTEREAWVQNANSTAALVLGWLTAWLAFPESLGIFYASAAVVLGLASWRRTMTAPGDTAGAVLLAKALGALTLAVIKWTDPELTALALMVQAGVMLATNRRLRSPVIAAGSGIVATVALAYWIQDTAGHPVSVTSVGALGRALTFAGFVAWGMELARDCGVAVGEESRRTMVRTVSGVGAFLALMLALSLTPATWLPAWCVAGAAVLAGAGLAWRRTEPWLAAGAVLVGAHLAFWSRLDGAGVLLGQIWGNAVIVLTPTVSAAWWLGEGRGADSRRAVAWAVSALALVTLGAAVCVGHGATASLLSGLGLATALAVGATWQPARKWLWLATWAFGVGVIGHAVATFGHRGTAGGEMARWMAALGALIGPAVLAAWPRGRAQLAAESPRGGTQWILAMSGVFFGLIVAFERSDAAQGLWVVTGFAALAAGLLTWIGHSAFRGAGWIFTIVAMAVIAGGTGSRMLPATAITLAIAWLPALGWARSAWVRARWASVGRDAEWTSTVQTWLAGVLTAVAIRAQTSGDERVWWFAGATIVALAVARLGFAAVVEVATGFAVLGLGYAAALVTRGDMEIVGFGTGFGAVVASAVVATVLARLLPDGRLWEPAQMRAARSWCFPAAGLVLVFALMLGQRGELRPYVTVGWGVASLAWFGFGLFMRARPDRLLGLVGLALCVPRMFWVDLHSTLYRIVAFGALGAVLLWVGFSYHRFRHLIADETPPAPRENDSDKKL